MSWNVNFNVLFHCFTIDDGYKSYTHCYIDYIGLVFRVDIDNKA